MALLFRGSPRLPSTQSTFKLSKVLLQLPPAYRAFHTSPRTLFIVSATHDALTALHSFTGLPWAYTIPLFALTIRTTLILPLSIYQRRGDQHQASLVPLLQSWRYALEHEAMRKVGHLGPLVAERTLMRELRKKRIEIYRRWGCGLWKNYLGLAQLPIFLAIMEALRAMSGAKQGWWGMLSGATAGADRTEAVLTADGLVSTALIPVESTFAIEGALWFPNLLLPDPQLALPFMLSGAILLNIFGHRPAVIGKWQKRFTRNMGLIALAIGPIMINVPSALLCYWVSSSMLAYGQALLLGRFMPIKKPVTPCKPKKLLKSGLGLPVKTKS